MLGGPTYTFVKPWIPENLIEDLIILYVRLVDLDVVYRNHRVCVTDLSELDVSSRV